MSFFDSIPHVSHYFRSQLIDSWLKTVDSAQYTQFIVLVVQSTVYIQGCIISLSGLMILNDSFLENLLHVTSLDKETFTSNFMLAIYMGGFIGAMCSYLFGDAFGRQKTMVFATLCCFVSLVSNAVSYNLITFLLSRFMVGFSLGLILSVAPLYISEISTAENRGRNVGSTTLSINIGLVMSGVSYLLFHHLSYGWRLCTLIPICTSFLSILALMYVPESPRWLLAKKTPAECLDALRDIRRCNDVSIEFNIIYAALLSDARLGDSWLDILQTSSIFYRMALACFLQLSQQLVGIQLMSTYSADILSSLSIHSTAIALAIAYIASFIGSVICLKRVDVWGRRFVMLSGCACMLFSWLGALMSIYTGGLDDGKAELYYSSYVLKFFFGSFVALFCCFYSFSLGPVSWVTAVEIFPARARAKAAATCTACYSLSYILGAWLLDSWLISSFNIKQSIVVFCATIASVGLVCYLFMPETNRVDLDEMELLFDVDDSSCLYCRGKSLFLGLAQRSSELSKTTSAYASSSTSKALDGAELIDPDTLHKYSSSMKGIKFEYYSKFQTGSGGGNRSEDFEADPLIARPSTYQSAGSAAFNL